ncbi:hypothetical protein [Pelotomaculum propionicicum]|nr:hypothetical protein [Peptococcaceae bacterium]
MPASRTSVWYNFGTVYEHLKKIKRKGYITFEPGRPRTLRVVK